MDKHAAARSCRALTGLAALVALLAGCSAHHVGTAAVGTVRPSTSGAPSATDTPGAVSQAPVVPTTPAVQPSGAPAPVVRPGASTPASRLVASNGDVQRSPATYPDGVQVSASDVRTGVVSATGAGALTGQPMTRLALHVTNGSHVPLDLSHVVVTLMVGAPAAQATAVYDDTLQDLSGTLAPGASVSQDYAFSVPTTQRGQAHLYVDLDAGHLPAVLVGSV